jgi:uncharacterized protein YpmB
MTGRALQTITFTSWISLAVGAMALVYLALAVPNAFPSGAKNDREQTLADIRASTDLSKVQQIAIWRTKEEGYLAESARLLLILSVSALLVSVVCTGITLAQARQMKRQSGGRVSR